MKQIVAIGFIFLIAVKASGQSVRFSPLSWRDALIKAKSKNKMLFVDMYTTWCTYCKQMDETVFSTGEAGKYYNEHFVNVRFDALRGDGNQIRKNYTLLGFPTFLYLDPNGLVILKTAGYQDVKKFISNGDSAVSTYRKKQLLSLK